MGTMCLIPRVLSPVRLASVILCNIFPQSLCRLFLIMLYCRRMLTMLWWCSLRYVYTLLQRLPILLLSKPIDSLNLTSWSCTGRKCPCNTFPVHRDLRAAQQLDSTPGILNNT